MADFSGMIKAIRDWAVGKFITEIPIGSQDSIGAVKADGTTTTIDSDGTIHASGGGGGEGTTDYNALSNKPSIGGVTLSGNKTLEELGIQPEGNYVTEEELTQKGYLTEETDPTVPDWAKAPEKPSYTAEEVGADEQGSASTALANAKAYVDQTVANLIDGAPETLNTLKEISDALAESEEAVEAINTAIGNKQDKTGDSLNNTVTFTQATTRENIKSTETHSTLFGKISKWFSDLKTVAFSGSYEDLTDKPTIPTVPEWAKAETKPTYSKSEVGLGNVPNVATNDQTPTFTEASERANIVSGEKLSVIFGKVMKWFSDLKPHAFVAPITNLLTTVAGSALDATMGTELNNKIVANTTAIEEANSSLATVLSYLNYTGTRSGVGIVGNFIQGYGCMVNIPLDRADLRNITVKSITVYGTSTVPTYTFSGTTTDGFSLTFDEDLSGKRISVSYTAPLK